MSILDMSVEEFANSLFDTESSGVTERDFDMYSEFTSEEMEELGLVSLDRLSSEELMYGAGKASGNAN